MSPPGPGRPRGRRPPRRLLQPPNSAAAGSGDAKARSGRGAARQRRRRTRQDLATGPAARRADIHRRGGPPRWLDIPRSRRRYQPRTRAAHQATGFRVDRLAPTASVARVVATSDVQGDRHAGARTDRVHEAIQLPALTLVLTEHPAPTLPVGRPHGDPLEVVQPPVAPVTGHVQSLLREAGAAVGQVGDGPHRTVWRSAGWRGRLPPTPMACTSTGWWPTRALSVSMK